MNWVDVGLLAIGLLWVWGGFALRLLGRSAFLAAAVGLVLTGDPACLVLAVVGVVGWLAGHRHFALRHGVWRSRPALIAWESRGGTIEASDRAPSLAADDSG